MNRCWAICLVVAAVPLTACNREEPLSEASVQCSEAWYRTIEEKLPTGDGQGHGPDVGSDEWKSVVEFKLGIRGEPGVPGRDSEAWCQHIDELVRSGRTPSARGGDSARATGAAGPSFDCGEVSAGSTAARVCGAAEMHGKKAA